MNWLWNLLKYTLSFFVLVGLVFSSGVFSLLLYGKMTGKEWAITYGQTAVVYAERLAQGETAAPTPAPTAAPPPPVKKASAMLEAPIIRQHPELPSGCEITSLTMLLQYKGVQKGKLDLAAEMKKDPTPMRRGADGSIEYWGNPNTGFVGDVTGKSRGFGIYHTALMELLSKYAPTAVDLTKSSFDKLEQQVADGFPVVVWTTLDFKVPANWVVWDTPTGPIQTTFMEHAVLLVGYDEGNVYVNDPWTGKAQRQVNKESFVKSWEAMGKQALSYTKE